MGNKNLKLLKGVRNSDMSISPFTISIEERLVFALLTAIMFSIVSLRLRYNGFIALLAASIFNIIVKVLIIWGVILFGDTSHSDLIGLQDFSYMVASGILLYDFLVTPKHRHGKKGDN